MHARELMELSGTLASHSHLFREPNIVLRRDGLEQYWIASKCRLDRWGMALTAHITRVRNSQIDPLAQCQQLRPVLEEIFVSEALTRIWTALCCESSRHYSGVDVNEAESVAKNVFAGHLEATSRALKAITPATGMGVEDSVNLNRLRRTTERWNDVLLGLSGDFGVVRQFAHSEGRLADHLRRPSDSSNASMLAAIRLTYSSITHPSAANPTSNRAIVDGILASIPPDCFDSIGHFSSRRVSQLYRSLPDARGKVEQLFAPKAASGHGTECADLEFPFRRVQR